MAALTGCDSDPSTTPISAQPTAYPSASPADGPPGSPSSFATRLEERVEVPAHGIVLTPSDEQPAISGEQALETAWHEDGWDADTATAIYAHFTRASPAIDDLAVWVVRYEGACVPLEGPATDHGATPGCAADTINVVIDATTGDYIESFS